MFANTNCARVPFLAGSALSLLGLFSVPAHAQQPPAWELAHAGTIFDAFTLDGNEFWTVEDGGRVRHRDAAGVWTFQEVPWARDVLYRVQFIDSLHGWICGLNGELGKTIDGGAHWTQMSLQQPQFAGNEQLWDVHFIDQNYGWLVAEHGLYWTNDAGATWWDAAVFDADGGHILNGQLPANMEYYSLDLVPTVSGPFLPGWAPPPCVGLMSARPGLIFRTTDGITWQQVFDIRNLCATPSQMPSCMSSICNPSNPGLFDAWDIDLTRGASGSLALMVGGLGFSCGMAFGSIDDGLTWKIEPHECTCTYTGCNTGCATDPLYNPGMSTPSTWRLNQFYTLYSVSIFDANLSAIAGGYSGQHLLRNPSTSVWEDRSEYNPDVVNTPTAITLPMFATAAGPGLGTPGTGTGLIAGAGGFIRRTASGGQSWTRDVPGDPWRVQDLCFISNTTGWIVGQYFRIAKSTDGGVTWNELQNAVTPAPIAGGASFLSIAMNSSGSRGVAVGQAPAGAGPKVRYTLDPLGKVWQDVTVGTGNNGWELREVEWAGGSTFWTAGKFTMIYFSTDDGQTWSQYSPPGFGTTFDIRGLGVSAANKVVFVGSRNGAGEADLYDNTTGTPTWTHLTVPTGITSLSDVDMGGGGNIAYAVGIQGSSPNEQGLILWCDISSSTAFQVVPGSPTVASVTVGENLDVVPVLNRVQLTTTGELWVAGECGRMWHRDALGSWSSPKSSTDAHIRGLSFPGGPLGGHGFACELSTGLSYAAFSVIRYH